jgi:hypothetical protein
MGRADFIPEKDVDFHEWQGNLFVHVNVEAERLGISPRVLESLVARRERWEAAVAEKQAAREAYEVVLRPFIEGWLAGNERVTAADRKILGLPVHGKRRTRAWRIESRPEVEVEVKFGDVRGHVLVVRDGASGSTGLPSGVAGFEVWRKVGGELPVGEEEWLLVRQVTRSPHVLAHDEADAGKRVYYRARWVSTRGVPGPWSETASIVIG